MTVFGLVAAMVLLGSFGPERDCVTHGKNPKWNARLIDNNATVLITVSAPYSTNCELLYDLEALVHFFDLGGNLIARRRFGLPDEIEGPTLLRYRYKHELRSVASIKPIGLHYKLRSFGVLPGPGDLV